MGKAISLTPRLVRPVETRFRFAPVGLEGATVNVAPPLTITADAIQDGLAGLREAVTEAAAERECL
jgi:4-aminobutyrate aminotransferase-like enzyme